MRSLQFLHIADAHLDSPFKGMTHINPHIAKQLQDASFQAFDRLVDIAIREAVSFVLLVGDVYHHTQPSVRARLFLYDACQKLFDAKIPVIICHGNHDFVAPTHDYGRLPDNVYVLNTAVETVELTMETGETVAISGFSYGSRHVWRCPIGAYPKRYDDVTYHIGMLHGFSEQLTGESERRYAAFSVADLLSKQYDYWALGHVHRAQTLHANPPIVYPGNCQGLHRNEVGPKGGVLVTLSPHQRAQCHALTVAPVEWQQCEVALNQADDLITAVERLFQRLQNLSRRLDTAYLMSVTWSQTGHLTPHVQQQLVGDEVIAHVNAQMEERGLPIQVVHVAIKHEALQPLAFDQVLSQRLRDIQRSDRYNELYLQAVGQLTQVPAVQSLFEDLAEDATFRQTVLDRCDQLLAMEPASHLEEDLNED